MRGAMHTIRQMRRDVDRLRTQHPVLRPVQHLTLRNFDYDVKLVFRRLQEGERVRQGDLVTTVTGELVMVHLPWWKRGPRIRYLEHAPHYRVLV